MASEVRLLIVEDDQGELNSWKLAIESHNVAEKSDVRFAPTYAPTAEEALSLIEQRDFDAAVIDIRLKKELADGEPDKSGNLVLARILESEMAVVAAYSGDANAVDIPAWANHVREFQKGGGNGPVIKWLAEQGGMIEQIRYAQATIKREMARVFVRSVWPRWANWLNNEPPYPKGQVRTALARHITSHVLVSLLAASEQRAHAEEWYFVPPIGDKLMTGDLVREGETVEVVVTPRCDIATGKYLTMQLATCEPCPDEWKKALIQLKKNPKSMPELLQHNRRFAEHFLPPMKQTDGTEKGPYLVKFARIRSIPQIEAEALVSKRIATLTPEFLPSMVERLGAYFSRIGTPNYMHLEPDTETTAAGD